MRRFLEARPLPAWARRRRVRWPLGLGLAVLMLVAYYGSVKPARVWFAEDLAGPVFATLETPRAQTYQLQQPPGRRSDIWAVPKDATPEDVERRTATWSAPLGALFLMPAMFLIGVFPTRLFWLVLLAYHSILGVAAFGAFYVGLGWFAPAFMLYEFSQTYVAETISLVVPLLLWLAGRRADATTVDGATGSETAVSDGLRTADQANAAVQSGADAV